MLHGLPQIPKSVPAFAVVATVIKHLEESLLKNLLHHVCRTNSRGPLRPSQWPDQRRSEKRRQMLRNKCDQIWRNFTTLAKNYKSLTIFEGLFSICPNIYLNFVIFCSIGQIFNVAEGQIFNKQFSHLVTLGQVKNEKNQ